MKLLSLILFCVLVGCLPSEPEPIPPTDEDFILNETSLSFEDADWTVTEDWETTITAWVPGNYHFSIDQIEKIEIKEGDLIIYLKQEEETK